MTRRFLALLTAALLSLGLLGSTASAAGPWYDASNPQTPDSEVNVVGEPFQGTTSSGAVQGMVDGHTHMFSDLGFGGNAVCGATWSAAGPATALQDCAHHYPDGSGATLENLTNSQVGGNIFATHDPNGWPTFTSWPTWSSFTHQQMYYKWVERAWRGGQRIMVNDLVNNSGLCQILGTLKPPNKYSCDDMEAIRREAAAARSLEAFIDAQFGGAGKGWYRIVTSPQQARDVVAQGKLAVVLGVEVSEPFGCKQTLGIPGCDKAAIDRGLDEFKSLGISSMFLCHKFDNALCGVRYDEGTTGVIVNLGQFITTGTWWNPQTCKPGEVPDNTVSGGALPPSVVPAAPLAVMPVYPAGPHCNPRGLTDLGDYALRGLIKRGMIVELDHMSAKAADRALDILEDANYGGAVSSHSWMNDQFMDRMFRLGGVATQYGHGAAQFVSEWQASRAVRAKYGVAYGYGMDMNGFGGTPPPPGAGSAMSYPFTSVDGGSTLTRQVSGQRTFDYNVEGVAHYGMIPDWVADTTGRAPELKADLLGGAESYLRTMERARGWQAQTNLARGKPTSASSSQWDPWGSFSPSKANDGNWGTRWASNWGPTAWWQVDLGSAQPVARVGIYWEAAYAKSFTVQVSNDGWNWREVWSTAGQVSAGTGGVDTAVFPTTNARWVRINNTVRGLPNYGYSIHEVGIYAK